MKHCISYAIAIITTFLMVGCQSKQEEYKLEMYVLGTDAPFSRSWLFTASSNEEANDIGIRLVNQETATSFRDYVRANIDYNLYRITKNKTIEVPFHGNETDVFNQHLQWEIEQNPLAYAGTTFGMSISDVLRIPHFNSFQRKDNQLFSKETLGGVLYNVNLLFDDHFGLYYVAFTTPYESKNHLNTSISNAVNSFSKIIQKANGGASRYFDYPKDSDLETQDNYVVARWFFFGPVLKNLPNKRIEIGVETNDAGDKYRMFGVIFVNIEDIQQEDASVLF
jgi:hypothetical protein